MNSCWDKQSTGSNVVVQLLSGSKVESSPYDTHAVRLVILMFKGARSMQAFKPGRRVRARVIGQRLMDGLAVCSLKAAVVEAGALSYADIAPGSLASGTVEKIEDFGMFVKLAPGIKCVPDTLTRAFTLM